MRHNRIIIFLSCILAVSCVIMMLTIASIYKKSNYLPESAIVDIVNVLAADNIFIDPEIVSTKLERGTVYVCASEEYNSTVAELIGNGKVKSVYAVPNGEIIILASGERFEFYENFSFRYLKNETSADMQNSFTVSESDEVDSENFDDETIMTVKEFLESGSAEFLGGDKLGIITEINGMWEKNGKRYALCSRKVNGVPIAGNTALCEVENGEVTEAYGMWCFITLGESYSAQLSDYLNILFNVKKEISLTPYECVQIESIELCYSLYFLGDDDFCLIPCWKIITDLAGEFIYNAIDGELYTKI